MASEQGLDERLNALGRFLSYSGIVVATLPTANDAGTANPIPFTYAVMAGLNKLILEGFQQRPPLEVGKIKIDRAAFRNKLTTRRRWLGDAAQFNTTLTKLAGWGYLTRLQNEIRVESSMMDSLQKHAKSIFEFMTNQTQDDHSAATAVDWLLLNEEIFSKFFFGEFGNVWRDLREEVNNKLRQATDGPKRKKTSRTYSQDFVNRNPNLWVAFNAIALGGAGNKYKLFEHIEKYKLHNMAPETAQVEEAAQLLVASGVLTFAPETKVFDIAPALSDQADRYKTAIENGLATIAADCTALMRKLRPELEETGG